MFGRTDFQTNQPLPTQQTPPTARVERGKVASFLHACGKRLRLGLSSSRPDPRTGAASSRAGSHPHRASVWSCVGGGVRDERSIQAPVVDEQIQARRDYEYSPPPNLQGNVPPPLPPPRNPNWSHIYSMEVRERTAAPTVLSAARRQPPLPPPLDNHPTSNVHYPDLSSVSE